MPTDSHPAAASPRACASARGLTLVELMIAMALMLVLTLQLQIIFGNARKLFLGADAMAQVYSNARSALDQIERDVANAVKTDQMEFFNDKKAASSGVGHYNPGEQNSTITGKFVPGRYLHSMAFRQPKEYEPKDKLKVGGPYRHDSVYFRTFTTVNGQPREVLIQYRLWLGNDDTNPRPRPILQRVVTAPRIDSATGAPMYDANGNPILEQLEAQDICYYVQEFKVDLFIRDKRKRTAGRFYSPKDTLQKTATPDDAAPPGLANLLAGGEEIAIECLDGSDTVDPKAQLSTSDGKLYLRNGDTVARLGPGDRMYLISKPQGGGFQVDFQNRYLTIKDISIPGPGETVVSFDEEDAIKQYVESQASQGIPYLEMAYRGGWIPQAIRVQMKVKDQRSEEIRTLTRVFQLLRA